MLEKNIDIIIQKLNDFLKLNTNYKDESMIKKLITKLTDLKLGLMNLDELSNYFDPIYIMLKKEIHKSYVAKKREENRLKREEKLI